jgi:aryl-alcohol dehydrogenase-like predicted oxidoreductase
MVLWAGTYCQMIDRQPFGATGHASSRIIFGAYALSNATEAQAARILEILLEHGVNHIDVARMYGNAEKLIGSWMSRHRDDFFVATKSRSRTYSGARKDLQRSLEQLRVDHIDLWQLHGLTNQISWEKVMGPGGALEAFVEARDEGLVRYLGVTGHGNKVAAMHLQSLERFDFDSVLLPYNYCQMQMASYAVDFGRLLDICRERNIAIQTTKAIARGPVEKRPGKYNTYFYEPLETDEAIEKSVHWAMGLPDCFVITAGDMQFVPRILQSAERFKHRPSDGRMNLLVSEYHIQRVFK